MSYKEFIDNILETRGRFACGDEYKERHHIIPKCIGGSNDEDNLIDLYAREHFEAHRLLALENPSERGLQFAWWNMSQCTDITKQRYQISSEEYEEIRVLYNKLSTYEGNPNAKSVNQYGLDGNFIKSWNCIKEAADKLCIDKTGIGECCNKRQKTAGDFQWKFADDNSVILPIKKSNYDARSVIQYDKYGKFINQFNSIAYAEQKTNIARQDIGKCCMKKRTTAGGYLWKYADDVNPVCVLNNYRHFEGVNQYTKNGEFIKYWESARQAAKELEIQDNKIILVCQGKRKTTGGFIWKYADCKDEVLPVEYRNPNAKIITQYTTDGNLIDIWNTIKEASKFTNIGKTNISACVQGRTHTAGGFKWCYLYDQTKRNGEVVQGAISLGLITEEEALKQLENKGELNYEKF